MLRRHHLLGDLFFAAVGRDARYASTAEAYEPAWARVRQNAAGEWEVKQARLDNPFSEPPADPLGCGDVVVSHPEGRAWLTAAATADGTAAESPVKGKHGRYPAEALSGAWLLPFSVEAGRWRLFCALRLFVGVPCRL